MSEYFAYVTARDSNGKLQFQSAHDTFSEAGNAADDVIRILGHRHNVTVHDTYGSTDDRKHGFYSCPCGNGVNDVS